MAGRLFLAAVFAFILNRGATQTSKPGLYTTIPFDMATGLIIIPVEINGKTFRFLLDTGAPTCISSRLDSALQLNKTGSFTYRDGNNVQARSAFAWIDSLSIGSTRFGKMKVAVLSSPLFSCLQIDGLLGNDALMNHCIYIDANRKVITISNDRSAIPYKLSKAGGLPLMYNKQGTPHITVRLTHKQTTGFITIFDTGFRGFFQMADTFAARPALRAYFEVPDSAKMIGSNSVSIDSSSIDELRRYYRLLLPKLQVGSAIFKNVHAESSYFPSNILGVYLLKYGNCLLDNIDHYLYFIPFAKTMSMTEKWLPITIGLSGDDVIVTHVWDAKRGDRVDVGDKVLMVNKRAYTGNNYCNLVQPDPFTDKTKIVLQKPDKAIKTVDIEKY